MGGADRDPIALPAPRRLPVVPGRGLLGRQSRSPRELGRWVGGAGVGNPSRELRAPGPVAAPGAARSPRCASLPSPHPALRPHHPRRAQLRRELSSPKLQEMFSQVVAVEASFLCVCVCVCVCVCIRAHALGRGVALGRGGTREASHLAKTRFLSLWAL